MTETERRLATIEEVVAVRPIPDADAIEVAVVRGWDVVMKKGEVSPGDLVVYFEIDSALPLSRPEFAFLAPRGEKTIEVDGVTRTVHVLKTARLRGQVSQGLALPLSASAVDDAVTGHLVDAGELASTDPVMDLRPFIGADVTEAFGVVKYEPPLPAELEGKAVGPFPTNLLLKTGAPRVQNLTGHFEALAAHPGGWYASEKIDGVSTTIINDGSPRICSRNWELIWDDEMKQVRPFVENGLVPDPGWAVQAEVYGEGMPTNPLRVKGLHVAVFNVLRDGGNGYFVPVPRESWPQRFLDFAAPILDLSFPASIEEAVAQADGLKSAISPERLAEGIVWHSADGAVFNALDGRETIKAISNKFLLKNGG